MKADLYVTPEFFLYHESANNSFYRKIIMGEIKPPHPGAFISARDSTFDTGGMVESMIMALEELNNDAGN